MNDRIDDRRHFDYSTQSWDSVSAPPERADAMSSLPDAQLRELRSSGDLGASLAVLLLDTSKASQEIARRARDAAYAAEEAAAAAKTEHMKRAADERLVGGIASGGMKICSGAAEGGGELGRNMPIKASAKSLEGGGETARTVTDYLASNEDIEREHEDRAMLQAKRDIDAAGDADRDAKELMRRVMGHYAEYVQAKDDASKAALFRA